MQRDSTSATSLDSLWSRSADPLCSVFLPKDQYLIAEVQLVICAVLASLYLED